MSSHTSPILGYDRLARELTRIKKKSVEPFQELLTTLLGCQPTEEALLAWAEKKPAEWISSMSVIAKLCGYHEKIEVINTIEHKIANASQAELEAMLAEAVHAGPMISLTSAEFLALPEDAGQPALLDRERGD